MQPSCLTTPISFGTTTVLTDNLGGVGPSTGDPVIRYGGVGQANGTPFDLVVQVEKGSSYSTPLGNDNGAYGPFGQLNIGAGTRSKLRFSFVKPNSMEEVGFLMSCTTMSKNILLVFTCCCKDSSSF